MSKKISAVLSYRVKELIHHEATRIEDTRVYHIPDELIEKLGICKKSFRSIVIQIGYFTRTHNRKMFVSKNKYDIVSFIKRTRIEQPRIG